MQLRHHLENELMSSREELSETPDILIDGLLENLSPLHQHRSHRRYSMGLPTFFYRIGPLLSTFTNK